MSNRVKQLYADIKHCDDVIRRIDLLNELANEFLNNDLSRFERHTYEVLELSKENGYTEGEINAYLNLGRYHYRKNDADGAQRYFLKAVKLSRNKGYDHLEAVALDNLSPVFWMLGDMENAKDYAQRALDILERLDDPHGVAIMSLNNIGNVYQKQGEYEEALDYYRKALQVFYEKGTIQARFGLSIKGNIGIMLIKTEQYQKALDHFLPLLNEFEQHNHDHGKPLTLANIGLCYNKLGQYSNAVKYYSEALKLVNRIESGKKETTNIHCGLGDVYLNMGGYDEAMKQYRKSLEVGRKINYPGAVCNALLSMGRAAALQKDMQAAGEYLNEARALALEKGFYDELEGIESVAESHEIDLDFKQKRPA